MATFKPNGIRRNTPTHATADDAIRHTSDRTHNGTELVKNATPDAAILKSDKGRKEWKGFGLALGFLFYSFLLAFFFSLPFVARTAFSQITGRRAVPLRHLTYLSRLLSTVFRSFRSFSLSTMTASPSVITEQRCPLLPSTDFTP